MKIIEKLYSSFDVLIKSVSNYRLARLKIEDRAIFSKIKDKPISINIDKSECYDERLTSNMIEGERITRSSSRIKNKSNGNKRDLMQNLMNLKGV